MTRRRSPGWPARLLLAAAAAAALVGGTGVAGAAPLRPGQEPEAVALARAFTAAWNAQNVAAVLACLAPDAEITYPGGGGLGAAGDAGHDEDTGGGIKVIGTAAIRAHLRAQFRWPGHVEAWDYRAGGGDVTWSYRQRDALEQRLPGVEPVEGAAVASVRAGRITRLRLAPDPASVAARATVVAALASNPAAHPDAARSRSAAAGPPGPTTGAQPAPEVTTPAWPLGLLGLGGAALLARWHRRRPHRG